jgi:hypothetical protein
MSSFAHKSSWILIFMMQVAYNYFGDAVTYEPRPSIASGHSFRRVHAQ